MVKPIQAILPKYGVDGNILLYRDEYHKKKGLCEYIAKTIPADVEVVTYSDGAFGLYLARALPNHTVHTCYNHISPDYGELMEAQPNLVLHSNMKRAREYAEFVALHDEYFEVNQYTQDIIKDYYKEHFKHVVGELEGYDIDAFCDYGHSGATLRGFVEANREMELVDWNFIMATIDSAVAFYPGYVPRFRNHLNAIKDDLEVVFAGSLDTYKLGLDIEYKLDVGNIYEATRSIAGAIAWLRKHPGDTVLVYVGDSYEKEGTKFRGNSNSRVGSKELVLAYDFWQGLKEGKIVPKERFIDYLDSIKKECLSEYRQFLLTKFIKIFCEFQMKEEQVNRANVVKFTSYINMLLPEVPVQVINFIWVILSKDKLLIEVNAAECSDAILRTFAYRVINLDKDSKEYQNAFKESTKINSYLQSIGSLL